MSVLVRSSALNASVAWSKGGDSDWGAAFSSRSTVAAKLSS